MKRDYIYIMLILLVITAGVRSQTQQVQQTKYHYYEEEVRHGMHYGIWSNTNQGDGFFIVRCIEEDSIAAKQFWKSTTH